MMLFGSPGKLPSMMSVHAVCDSIPNTNKIKDQGASVYLQKHVTITMGIGAAGVM